MQFRDALLPIGRTRSSILRGLRRAAAHLSNRILLSAGQKLRCRWTLHENTVVHMSGLEIAPGDGRIAMTELRDPPFVAGPREGIRGHEGLPRCEGIRQIGFVRNEEWISEIGNHVGPGASGGRLLQFRPSTSAGILEPRRGRVDVRRGASPPAHTDPVSRMLTSSISTAGGRDSARSFATVEATGYWNDFSSKYPSCQMA